MRQTETSVLHISAQVIFWGRSAGMAHDPKTEDITDSLEKEKEHYHRYRQQAPYNHYG